MKGRMRMIFGSSDIYLIRTFGRRSRDGIGFEPTEEDKKMNAVHSVLLTYLRIRSG